MSEDLFTRRDFLLVSSLLTASLAGCGGGGGASTGHGTAISGGSSSTSASAAAAQTTAVSGLNVSAVSDRFAYQITTQGLFQIDANGYTVTKVGSFTDGGLTSSLFNFPMAMATDNTGKVFVCDCGNQRIDVLSATGNLLFSFGSFGNGPSQFSYPRDIAIDQKNALVYVADSGNRRVQVFNTAGLFLRFLTTTQLNAADSLALDPAGNIHVVDSATPRVDVFMSNGTLQSTYGSFGPSPGQFLSPQWIAIDGSSHAYVADPASGFISIFVNGVFQQRFQPISPSGGPGAPIFVAVDPSGNLYITTYPK